MPGFRTHYLFGKTTNEQYHLRDTYTCIRNYPFSYQLGQQGPDIFFYYLPSVLTYPKSVGTLMHTQDVMAFFAALFECRTHLMSKKDKQIADAYIMGFIGHYTLDVAAHPYVQFRIKKTAFKDRPKYAHGNHVYLETDIDVALQRHYLHLDATEFRPEHTIALSKRERFVISLLLSRAMKRIYPSVNMSAIQVRLAIRSTCLLTALTFDPRGWKKKLVRLIDERIYHHAFYSPIIANNGFRAYRDPLNLRHLPWHNPWNKKMSSKQDFYELMDDARDIYVKRLEMYARMMKDTLTSSVLSARARKDSYYHRLNTLLAELGDYSYSRGVPIK